ncbi:wd40 repeat-like protein [Gigaspora margarita]|uniref:Wd40 repeat-like protein n=1 Tax=Gigaspora margarita TaxID=4874 RepID=A0A8H4ETH3_GIGMA|nr:wd40 repeat-like protein [Gigaspora margarita]
MLKNCCFCIDLKSGTYIIAVLCIVAYLSLSFSSFGVEPVTGFMYLCQVPICVIGFIGVFKDNVVFVSKFSYYYWAKVVLEFFSSIVFFYSLFIVDAKHICRDMIDRHETDMDLETCISIITKGRILLVKFVAVICFIELYFAFVVWAYYKKLRAEIFGERHVNEEATPSYGTVQNQANPK